MTTGAIKRSFQDLAYSLGIYLKPASTRKYRMAYLKKAGGGRLPLAFMCSYPRSGNTWTRMMIAALLDENIKKVDLDMIDTLVPDRTAHPNSPARRLVIKEHAPSFNMFNKVIYNVRDGRDCELSAYKYRIKAFGYEKSFADFIFDREAHPFGFWHEHVARAMEWKEILPKRILFCKFEDLHRQPVEELCKIATFLKIETTPQRLSEIVELTNLKTVSKHPTADADNLFKTNTLGDGKTGKWKEAMDESSRYRLTMMGYRELRYFGYELSA